MEMTFGKEEGKRNCLFFSGIAERARGTRVEWGRDYTYDSVGNRLEMTKNDGIGVDVTYSHGYNGFGQRVAPAGMLWAI